MAKYIDVEKIRPYKGFFEKVDNVPKFYDWVESLPTADVQEVKHGRWVKQFDENCWWTECSECWNYPLKSAYGDEQLSDFCPYCGADMRERSEDE